MQCLGFAYSLPHNALVITVNAVALFTVTSTNNVFVATNTSIHYYLITLTQLSLR